MEKIKYNDPIINGVQYKTCSRCLTNKPATIDNFNSQKRGLFNVRRDCKECQKVYSKTIDCKFLKYKSSAKQRGVPFNLTYKQFIKFEDKKCFYCGRKTNIIGIDRIESLKDYSLENCVSCCTQCNWAKNASSMLEFFEMCRLVVETHNL